jgi:hypothetical protein
VILIGGAKLKAVWEMEEAGVRGTFSRPLSLYNLWFVIIIIYRTVIDQKSILL